MKRILPPLIAFVTVGVAWQLLVQVAILNPVLFPPPLTIIMTLWDLRQDFLSAFFESAEAVVVGFFLSALLGLLLAGFLSLFTKLRQGLLPFAIFFQTVPIIAVAPLLVIYFGFGLSTVIASSTIVAIFPVLASTVIALTSTPEADLELFRLYHASRWQTLWLLRWPSAYLGIYTGLRVAAGLAVIGAVAGEFVAGGGLGAMIDSARTQQRIDIVFAAILLLSIIGLSMIAFLRFIHMMLNFIRPFAKDTKE